MQSLRVCNQTFVVQTSGCIHEFFWVQTLYPEKIGFWVWVLGWVLYPKPKHKTQKLLYPNPKPKPKTQNPKTVIPKPKT
jgi:hypothetical protein